MNTNDFEGKILRTVTRYNNLYTYDVYVEKVYTDEDDGSGNGTMQYLLKGGFAVDLFLSLKEFLKFRFVLVQDNDKGYDFTAAEEKSIDIFLGSFSLLTERAQLVDPTFVTGQSKILAFLNHDFEDSHQNVFGLPFSRNLWLGIMLMFVICFLLIGIVAWVGNVPLSDIFYKLLSIILLKDCHPHYYKSGFRMSFLAISLFIMMLMACYTSNMVSMKAVRRFALNSMETIIESGYKILLEQGPGQHSSIRLVLQALSHASVPSKLLKRINDAKFDYQSFENTINEVRTSPSVFIIDEETGISTINKEIGHFPCSWSSVPVFDLKYPWVMYMRKNSQFKHLFNYGLLRFDESGLTKRLRQKWIPSTNECKGNVFAFQGISIHQVDYAFLILLTGTGISICWLVLIEKNIYSLVYYFNKISLK